VLSDMMRGTSVHDPIVVLSLGLRLICGYICCWTWLIAIGISFDFVADSG
ncbi:hypothetical protein A2U01_0052707, partial [Trifolium medium]|nr:hypothetical protein [Trifolium medium]